MKRKRTLTELLQPDLNKINRLCWIPLLIKINKDSRSYGQSQICY